MSLLEKLKAVQDTVPHYWPIGAFIHHNPLKGFEHLQFKKGLDKAQEIFGGRVYMDPEYYVGLYDEKKITNEQLDKNLLKMLKDKGLGEQFEAAKQFLLTISPQWKSLRSYEALKTQRIDQQLQEFLKSSSIYEDRKKWIASLTKHMTLYEIHDALFGTSEKELIEKDIIEYLARFLDEQQTTLSMTDRDLGMFQTFKLYENIDYVIDAQDFVQEALERLKVKDEKHYFLTHILKLHGWAGFIKYRSGDSRYYAQQQHPCSMIDYMAVRLHFELKYMQKEKINDFDKLDDFITQNSAYTILKLLQAKGKLTGVYNDAMEQSCDYEKILNDYIKDEIALDALQIQLAKKQLPQLKIPLEKFASFAWLLKKEEGFIWLKSLEDSYIKAHVEEFTTPRHYKEKPQMAAVFCLDVRSEIIRRNIEAVGAYKTYGAGGFLGIPIQFVGFDKTHHLNLAPAIVKPGNIVFEIPVEPHEEYNEKKLTNKTIKKVLSDLKNNPYTPYIMVESIGWMFGIKLFGKTFLPQKVNRLFSKMKPKKPKTTFTLDKLSEQEVQNYVKKLHLNIIKEVLITQFDSDFEQKDIELLWEHLVFNKPLKVKISQTVLDKLSYAYDITLQDYEKQKQKLEMVGFTLEEQATYLENLLKMIGLYNDFPQFVSISGHGSVSDNNPFESALDCGACGGSVSLPNARALCMIGNKEAVRQILEKRGISIPKQTRFIPAMHNTTTDEVEFLDTQILDTQELKELEKIKKDFEKASLRSREERVAVLPNASNEQDLFTKTMDWSEPRPEWGLAKNMGVFAGPRDSLKHMKFDNRLFMHSYDSSIDTQDAKLLTRIFNGPLVVGEWINLEHYFSTVDNAIYGAGSKVYHNIVSKVGVYNGNYSDLKIGLPTQSVLKEGKAYHEPVRLLTYMEAPLEIVAKAVENSIAKEFILNEWIRPVVIDKAAKKVYSYEDGDFIVIKQLNEGE